MPYWASSLHPKQTALALNLLCQFGYTTYYPHIAGRRRIEPLFPSYAFIAVCPAAHRARYCPGVRKLIAYGDRLAEISDEEISRIRRREGPDGLIRLPRARGLQLGDKVRVVRGPFEGQFSGVCWHERGRTRRGAASHVGLF